MAGSLLEDGCPAPEEAHQLAPERWAAGRRSAWAIPGRIHDPGSEKTEMRLSGRANLARAK